MKQIFISHSKENNGAAKGIRDWLVGQSWDRDQIFLDLEDMKVGERWRDVLDALAECQAVVACISDEWLTSPECLRELNLAEAARKPIFPIFVAAISKSIPRYISDFQIGSILSPASLKTGLVAARIDPQSFIWPRDDPSARVYRGLRTLKEDDAAIFFGRGAEIADALHDLRGMREAGAPGLWVILGASGAGKSSFLRAGLLARLRRDTRNFLTLPVVRPVMAAISGEQGLAASLAEAIGARPELTRPENLAAAFAAARQGASNEQAAGPDRAKAPTIVIAVDQAEELYDNDQTERETFFDLVAGALALDGNAIIAATIRTDTYWRLQTEKGLEPIPQSIFNLGPISPNVFTQVIEGPARVPSPPIAIEPELLGALRRDLDAEDALPLLAFTLERLERARDAGGTLTLDAYQRGLGGLAGAVKGAVQAALGERADAATLALARRAIVPGLVRVDEDGVKRRMARLADLPADTHDLVGRLVDQRLLVSARRKINGEDVDVIELAHEAILRQWPELHAWIEEDKEALRLLAGLGAASGEWAERAKLEGGRSAQSWLVHRGYRLEAAEALAARKDFSTQMDEGVRSYLAACRSAEDAARAREEMQARRTRLLQRAIGGLIAVATAVLIIAGLGLARLMNGLTEQRSASLAELARRASDEHQHDRAMRYALAALADAGGVFRPRARAAESELRRAAIASRLVTSLAGHHGLVSAVAASPDGTRVASGSYDDTARIWDAATGAPMALLHHDLDVNAVAYSPDGTTLATACDDRAAHLWDLATNREVGAFEGHDSIVFGVAFSADGARLATASWDGTARVWEVASRRQLALMRHDGRVYAVRFSADGAQLASASFDGVVRLWDAGTGALIAALAGHGARIADLSFSPDGARLATASDDGTAKLWDARSGVEIATLEHPSNVMSVAFSNDGAHLATGGADGAVRMWDARDGQTLSELWFDGAVTAVAFLPQGGLLASGTAKGVASVSRFAPDEDVARAGRPQWPARQAAFAPDDAGLAAASPDQPVRLWAGNGLDRLQIEIPSPQTVHIAFSSDGARLAGASLDGAARVWDVASGRQLANLQGHRASLLSVAFSPDGALLATTSFDETARIWDWSTGAQRVELVGHEDLVSDAAFSPDGARLATASYDDTARIWDARSGADVAVLQHVGDVNALAYSPDGVVIATAADDNAAHLWDARTGLELAALDGHSALVFDVAFSPNGAFLATASADDTVRIWDASSARQLAVRQMVGSVRSVSFAANAARVAAALETGEIWLWTLPQELFEPRARLTARLCEQASHRNLSRFRQKELEEAPVLHPILDQDACSSASLWARLGVTLGVWRPKPTANGGN